MCRSMCVCVCVIILLEYLRIGQLKKRPTDVETLIRWYIRRYEQTAQTKIFHFTVCHTLLQMIRARYIYIFKFMRLRLHIKLMSINLNGYKAILYDIANKQAFIAASVLVSAPISRYLTYIPIKCILVYHLLPSFIIICTSIHST